MAAPVIGTRPRYAPRRGAAVDASHPFAQRMEFCFIPSVNDTLDLAKGYVGTRTSTVSFETSSFGGGGYASGTTQRWVFNGVPDAPFVGPITLLWVGIMKAAIGSWAHIAGKQSTTNAANADIPWIIYGNSLNPRSLQMGRYNATSGWNNDTPVSVTPNTNYVVVASQDGNLASRSDWTVNGTYYQPTNQVTGTGAPTGVGAPIIVGSRAVDSLNSNTVTNALVIWSRVFSRAEASQLYADPFCFLRY